MLREHSCALQSRRSQLLEASKLCKLSTSLPRLHVRLADPPVQGSSRPRGMRDTRARSGKPGTPGACIDVMPQRWSEPMSVQVPEGFKNKCILHDEQCEMCHSEYTHWRCALWSVVWHVPGLTFHCVCSCVLEPPALCAPYRGHGDAAPSA